MRYRDVCLIEVFVGRLCFLLYCGVCRKYLYSMCLQRYQGLSFPALRSEIDLFGLFGESFLDPLL